MYRFSLVLFNHHPADESFFFAFASFILVTGLFFLIGFSFGELEGWQAAPRPVMARGFWIRWDVVRRELWDQRIAWKWGWQGKHVELYSSWAVSLSNWIERIGKEYPQDEYWQANDRPARSSGFFHNSRVREIEFMSSQVFLSRFLCTNVKSIACIPGKCNGSKTTLELIYGMLQRGINTFLHSCGQCSVHIEVQRGNRF